MNLHFNRLFLFTSLLLVGPAVQAQSDDDLLELLYGDEETVSIATGSNKPLHLAPSIASVITAEDIQAMGAHNIDDVLESVPGLHVSLSPRYSSLYSIRGIHTSTNPQVLLLINGYPITELYTGGRAPKFDVPVHNINRIEIIRGPGSAVYGADAFAGVINIITDDDFGTSPKQTEVGVIAGSFDTTGAWLKTGTELGDWTAGFSLEWQKSDGDKGRRVDNDLQTAFDGAFSTSASLAPGTVDTQYEVLNSQVQLNNQNWKFTASSWRQDNAGIGAGIANALDTTGRQDSTQHLLGISYLNDEWFDHWQIETKVNYFYMKQRSYYTIFPPGAVLPIGADGNLDFVAPAGFVSFPDGYIGTPGGWDKTVSAEVVSLYSGADQHLWRVAVGYKDQEEQTVETKNFGPGVIDGTQPVVDGTLTDVSNTPFVYMRDQTREIYYFSVQDEWSLVKDWELTAGVRFDDYSDFGNTVNPRLALVWQTHYNLTSKLLYGRAFRAPSFSELFAINNPVTVGNPDVEPEEIDTLEISFDYRPTYDIRTQLNLFTYKIDGLINFVPDPSSPGSFTAQNALNQDGHGIEAEISWALSDRLTLSGSYSWQHSENEGTGQEVPDAPQQLFYLDLRWGFASKWQVAAQLHYIGDRPRAAGDVRDEVDDYAIVNMTVNARQLWSQWDASFSLHNLFDEEAFEPGAASVPIDHPLQGRSILLNLNYRFNN